MMKWYSLMDKIYHKDNLRLAFKAVKRNHGVPGYDGETVELFADRLDENIEFLHQALKPKYSYPVQLKG